MKRMLHYVYATFSSAAQFEIQSTVSDNDCSKWLATKLKLNPGAIRSWITVGLWTLDFGPGSMWRENKK